MEKFERLEFIINYIQEKKSVSTRELSQILNVTEKTIRLDFNELEDLGLLNRVHGGAVIVEVNSTVFPNNKYRTRALENKYEIAKKALKMIKPNETIAIDDGSTSLELAKLLGDFPLTVLTNDVFILNELCMKKLINLYFVGGILIRNDTSYFFSGEEAISFIRKFRVDKVFLGVSTIDVDNGLMLYHYGNKSIKKAYMEISQTKICLADSEKFNKTAFSSYANLNEIDYIITDSRIKQDTLKTYSNFDLKIIN